MAQVVCGASAHPGYLGHGVQLERCLRPSHALYHLSIMQAPTPHLVAQFTEDSRATEDRLCEREACRKPKIRRGDPIYFVASYREGQPGKLVCRKCLKYYQTKQSARIEAGMSFFYSTI